MCNARNSKMIAAAEIPCVTRIVEVLARHDADLGHFGDYQTVFGRGWIVLHQLRHPAEVFSGIESIDAVAHRSLHVDRWIDLTRRGNILFAPRTERVELVLILQRPRAYQCCRCERESIRWRWET